MLKGQLALGAVQIVDSGTQEVIGYAFTIESAGGQLQRWLLYRDPKNAFSVCPPPSSMAGFSLADWQSNVSKLWCSGATYVWAQADLYQYGGVYNGVTWTQIPPASKLPPPSYYPSAPRQLDPDGRILRVLQGEIQGLAYSVRGLADTDSVEYWLMPGDYQPAGAVAPATIAVGTVTASSLSDFVDVANKSWSAGATFAITGCINYHRDVAPAQP